MTSPRYCFVIFAEQQDENGYIPSVVTEGEPGHSPLTGSGAFAAPWYWGKTYDEAKATAERENGRIGVTPDDALDIVMSSINASGVIREARESGELFV